jgi:hypothetical protein
MNKPGIPPHWKPTLSQLDLIAEMIGARVPLAAMASAVGLSPEAFIAWRRRSLAIVRSEEIAVQARYEVEPVRPPRPIPGRASNCSRSAA